MIFILIVNGYVLIDLTWNHSLLAVVAINVDTKFGNVGIHVLHNENAAYGDVSMHRLRAWRF